MTNMLKLLLAWVAFCSFYIVISIFLMKFLIVDKILLNFPDWNYLLLVASVLVGMLLFYWALASETSLTEENYENRASENLRFFVEIAPATILCAYYLLFIFEYKIEKSEYKKIQGDNLSYIHEIYRNVTSNNYLNEGSYVSNYFGLPNVIKFDVVNQSKPVASTQDIKSFIEAPPDINEVELQKQIEDWHQNNIIDSEGAQNWLEQSLIK